MSPHTRYGSADDTLQNGLHSCAQRGVNAGPCRDVNEVCPVLLVFLGKLRKLENTRNEIAKEQEQGWGQSGERIKSLEYLF